MIKTKIVRKTIIIFLIISLIYANLNLAILGTISYALDNNQIANVESTENQETEKPKALEVEISEILKNNMPEQETEYQEKLILNLDNEKKFNEIKISDIDANINAGEAEESSEESEETEKFTSIFYKTTKINKQELINKIGASGLLEIKYKELAVENEEQDVVTLPEVEEKKETIKLPEINKPEENENPNKGIIFAENGVVTIGSETEADEDGYITIIYPENTISVEIRIKTEVVKIEKLEIVNSKVIAKVENLDKINFLETTKQITVNGEEEILNTQETVKTPINYTKTVTELGVDKNQISTTVDSKVNFTMTMHTDNVKYDLYKNPYFILELSNIIEAINIDNVVILNNPCFSISKIEEGILENGNKAIIIKLEGEQTEYTESIEENTQIVLETTVRTKDLIPTTESNINLYYQNENAKTYDGIGTQANGISTVEMQFISNKEIIVETKAILGDKTISSARDNYNSVTVEPHTYQTATIIGTVINNIGENILNAKILGTATNVGTISGVEKVYYTENINATADLADVNNKWTTEHTPNAKKYLIIVENFNQAQTVQFGYVMTMPENITGDIEHVAKYEVYDNNNNLIKISKITINQEAEKVDIQKNELIQANMMIDKTEKVETDDYINVTINIANVSGRKLENASLNISVPEAFIITEGKMNGAPISAMPQIDGENLKNIRLNIEKDARVTIELKLKLQKAVEQKETIKADIQYEQKQLEVSSRIDIALPSQIETKITSDKLGKILEEGESIEYKVTLKNKGESHANIEIETRAIENMYIQKIEVKNLTTGIIRNITSGNLVGSMSDISINPNEMVEVYIKCVTKELKKDVIEAMSVKIKGDKIIETSTETLTNQINKRVEEDSKIKEQSSNANRIEGTAWLDKNQNGQKDENEVLLKGVQAVLIDTKTSKPVAAKTTNKDGEYKFDNIEKGKYIVEFRYDTNNLTVTDYKNKNVVNSLASDVINTTQNNVTTAKTEVIDLTKTKTENVNAGFVVNKKFDMSINKGITKVTVNNGQGTNTYDANNSNLAKVEIEGEYLKDSIILVEYEIAVTNIGEVEGYVKLISDKIPEGMKFNSELNKDWYEGTDGKLYSMALSNKKLLPGETGTVKLVLTKEMTDDKVVSPVNKANIEETFNEHLIVDKNKENDTAEATIIISLTTGNTQSYIWLGLVVVGIITLGILGVITISNKNMKKSN